MASPAGILRMYLCLLPLAAVATFYLLVLDRVTATSQNALAHAGFGLPFDWVEQDLSRYEPISFPTVIKFNFVRAWDAPIVTSYDWLMFGVNVVICGVGATAFMYALVYSVKWFRGAGRPASEKSGLPHRLNAPLDVPDAAGERGGRGDPGQGLRPGGD